MTTRTTSRPPLIVGTAPDRLGTGPGTLLAHRIDVAGVLPSVTLFGFVTASPTMDAMAYAAAELADAGATDVIAVGIDVARAFGAPLDLKPCHWSGSTLTGARVAWVPPPRSRWWNADRIEHTRRWFLALFELEDTRAGVEIVPLQDPAPHPRRTPEPIAMRRRARMCLDAAIAVTGAHPAMVRARERHPAALMAWRLAAYLSTWANVRSEVMGEILGITASHVRVDATKVRQLAAKDSAVQRLCIQADLAFEALDLLTWSARLTAAQARQAG